MVTMGESLALKRCCLCKGSRYTLIYTFKHHDVLRCQTCGLVRTADRRRFPTTPYNEDYFADINAYWRRRDEFAVLFDRLLGRLEKFKSSGRLLEVGCGIGLLLDRARRRGWTVSGVEVSEYAASFAIRELALDVKPGDLLTAEFPARSFDVVVINHVLEHLQWPPTELQETYRILKPNGVLAVGVPNFASWVGRLLGSRWSGLQPGFHIWHFTPVTLSQLLERHRFRVLDVSMENNRATGYRPKALVRRAIGWVALRFAAGEAMLFICDKGTQGEP